MFCSVLLLSYNFGAFCVLKKIHKIISWSFPPFFQLLFLSILFLSFQLFVTWHITVVANEDYDNGISRVISISCLARMLIGSFITTDFCYTHFCCRRQVMCCRFHYLFELAHNGIYVIIVIYVIAITLILMVVPDWSWNGDQVYLVNPTMKPHGSIPRQGNA